MMVKYLKYVFVMVISTLMGGSLDAQVIEATKHILQSPDKNISVNFYQKKLTETTKAMYYTVDFKGEAVILESDLDLQLDNHLSEQAMALTIDHHAKWCENLMVTGFETLTKNSSWKPLFGEKNEIKDNYNALIIHLVKEDNPIYKIDVEIRAYNEGAAIRYFFPENEKGTYYRIMSENTSFTLPADTKAWFAGWAQAPYSLLPLKTGLKSLKGHSLYN